MLKTAMNINSSKSQFKTASILLILLLSRMDLSLAEERKGSLNSLVISSDKGSEFQLEVRATQLSAVLDNISNKTKTPIHYSVLPVGLINATCVGSSLKPVLECLLAKKVDLVFRNSPSPSQANNIAEVWIMGSNFADGAGKNETCAASTELTKADAQAVDEQEFESNRTEQLLTMSNAKNPDDRATAIGALLTGDHKDDPAVKAVLEKALMDKNPAVRAQAVSTLAQFEGDNATALLEEALQDDSVDVRLMAVGGMTNNVALLKRAVNDVDETVRSLAITKLEELSRGDSSNSQN